MKAPSTPRLPVLQASILLILSAFLLLIPTGCGGGEKKPQLVEDPDPIIAPDKSPPEVESSLFGKGWVPASAPKGQIYDGNLSPRDIGEAGSGTAIDRLLRYKLIPIYEDGYFHPEQPLTRGEALLWLYNAYTAHESRGNASGYSPTRADPQTEFYDPAAKPYFRALAGQLKDKGLLDGYEEFFVKANRPVTREELATLAWVFTGQNGHLNHSKTFVNPSRRNAQSQREGDSGEPTEDENAENLDAETDAIQENLKRAYGVSTDAVTQSYLRGVNFLTTHRQGDLYQSVFLHKGEGKDLAPQAPVTRGEAAELLDRIQHDFEAMAFTTRKPKRPSRPDGYSHSSEERTEAEDPDFQDSSE